MSFDLVREDIKIRRLITRDSMQIILENDIIVPDTKADLEKVLFSDADVHVVRTEISEGNLAIDGVIRYKILYIEDSPDRSIRALDTTADFRHSIDIPGIDEEMEGEVRCEVEHVECQVINERKVNVRSILRVNSAITEEKELYFISDVENSDDVQLLKRHITVNKYIGSTQVTCNVKDTVEVPSGNPAILEILRNDLKISGIEYRVTDNKVIVNGNIVIKTLYTGNDREKSIRLIENEIPFNQIIDFQDAGEEADIDLSYEIRDYSFEAAEDQDGEYRFINGEIDLVLNVRGSIKQEMDTVVDAYGLRTNLSLEKINADMEWLVCQNRSQAVIKETLAFESDIPEIVEIYNVFSKPVLSEYIVEDNRIAIDGYVTNYILYYSNSPEDPICCYKCDIPLKHQVEMRGLKPGMSCDIKLDIEHSSYSMVSSRDVEIRLVIDVSTKAYDKRSEILTESILEVPDDESRSAKQMPSIVVYFVHEGDTLWEIAKKYRTTVEDIKRENKIEDENSITTGTQVFITRR